MALVLEIHVRDARLDAQRRARAAEEPVPVIAVDPALDRGVDVEPQP
jgi:hypothetical protein